MFGNDYKDEMDKIKPDGYIKDRVRRKLKGGENEPEKQKKAHFVIAAAAVVLCFAVLISAGGILGVRMAEINKAANTAHVKSVSDYDGVYKALQKFKPTLGDKITSGFNWYSNAKNNAVAEQSPGSGISESTAPGSDQAGDHSETTTQVTGVDEADIVKTDGNYIYILTRSNNNAFIKIVDARAKEPKLIGEISLESGSLREMYLSNDRLVVLGAAENNATAAVIYDVSEPAAPKRIEVCSQSGQYNTSRLIKNRLYIISDYYINVEKMAKGKVESFVPRVEGKGFNSTVSAECIYLYNNCNRPEYTVVCAFDINDGRLLSNQSVLGGSYTVYASTDNIITASVPYNGDTQVVRFKLADNEIKSVAAAKLSGSLLNQFSIDEYKGHFRFVLTDYKYSKRLSSADGNVSENTMVNSLVVLNGDLKEVGRIDNIAPDERVYSVRFMGDLAYFVTFRQVDPLFSADLSDPENPKIIGALKIPGFSDYLFPFGEGKLLGIGKNADELTGRTGCIKLSMFDITDPENVTESDKTDIDAYYSEALNNHKAILADYGKNIISFAAHSNGIGQVMYVYAYENGRFIERLAEGYETGIGNIRSLYIGDVFYIVNENYVKYFDINTFEKLGEINIGK